MTSVHELHLHSLRPLPLSLAGGSHQWGWHLLSLRQMLPLTPLTDPFITSSAPPSALSCGFLRGFPSLL